MKKEIFNKLRYLKVEILNLLLTLSTSEFIALDLKNISNSTSTAEVDLRGIISSVRRLKFNGDETLIMPAGRDSDGRLRWKINTNIINKEELADFLINEIGTKEKITWQK